MADFTLLSEPFNETANTVLNSVTTSGQPWRECQNGGSVPFGSPATAMKVNGTYAVPTAAHGYANWGGTLTPGVDYTLGFILKTANVSDGTSTAYLCLGIPQGASYLDGAGCEIRLDIRCGNSTAFLGHFCQDQNAANLDFSNTSFTNPGGWVAATEYAFQLHVQSSGPTNTLVTLLCNGSSLGSKTFTHFSTGLGVAIGGQTNMAGIRNFTVVRPLVAPGIPGTPVVTTNTGGTLLVSWTGPSTGDPPTSYGVYRSTGGAYTLINTQSAISYLDTAPPLNSTVTYKVLATNAAGSSAQSSASNSTVTGADLATGTLSFVSKSTTTIAVSLTGTTGWSWGLGGGMVQVQVAPDSGGSPGAYVNNGSPVAASSDPQTFTATGLTKGTNYWVRVVQTDVLGSVANSAGVNKVTDSGFASGNRWFFGLE